MLKYFQKNTAGRDFFVGDIHAHFDLLQQQLDQADFNDKQDRLFAVGDLIDRGPNPTEVTKYLSQPWFHSIRGNHEQLLINYQPIDKFTTISNGGRWFVELDESEKCFYKELFLSLPIAFEIETDLGLIGMVHADVPYHDWQRFSQVVEDPYAHATALWSRTRFELDDTLPVKNIDLVLVGHTPQVDSPRALANVVNLDGGVYQDNGKLVLLKLNELEEYFKPQK